MPYSRKMSDFPQLPIGASNQAAVDSSILKTESNTTEFTVSSAIFSSSTSYAGMAYHPPSLPPAPARSSIKNTTASARSAALRTTHSVQPDTTHSSLRQDAPTAEFAHPAAPHQASPHQAATPNASSFSKQSEPTAPHALYVSLTAIYVFAYIRLAASYISLFIWPALHSASSVIRALVLRVSISRSVSYVGVPQSSRKPPAASSTTRV